MISKEERERLLKEAKDGIECEYLPDFRTAIPAYEAALVGMEEKLKNVDEYVERRISERTEALQTESADLLKELQRANSKILGYMDTANLCSKEKAEALEKLEVIFSAHAPCYPGNMYKTNPDTGEVLMDQYAGNPCVICDARNALAALEEK